MWFSTSVDNGVDDSVRTKLLAGGGVALLLALLILGYFFGYLRAAFAIAAFLILASFGLRQVRSLANAPPEAELADVSDYGLKYVCTMCGLELKVEVAARDRPPTHCMEPMELVQPGGKPPITSVD